MNAKETFKSGSEPRPDPNHFLFEDVKGEPFWIPRTHVLTAKGFRLWPVDHEASQALRSEEQRLEDFHAQGMPKNLVAEAEIEG